MVVTMTKTKTTNFRSIGEIARGLLTQLTRARIERAASGELDPRILDCPGSRGGRAIVERDARPAPVDTGRAGGKGDVGCGGAAITAVRIED